MRGGLLAALQAASGAAPPRTPTAPLRHVPTPTPSSPALDLTLTPALPLSLPLSSRSPGAAAASAGASAADPDADDASSVSSTTASLMPQRSRMRKGFVRPRLHPGAATPTRGAVSPAHGAAASPAAAGASGDVPACVLRFPPAASCTTFPPRIELPDAFSSADEYVRMYCEAVAEEVNLALRETAEQFWRACGALRSSPAHAPQPVPTAPDALVAFLRKHRVRYYAACELIKTGGGRSDGKRGASGGGRGRRPAGKRRRVAGRRPGRGAGGEGGSSSEEDSEAASEDEPYELVGKPVTYYLKVRTRDRERATEYSKDDLWVLARSAGFEQPVVVRARFHSPSKADMLEVEPVGAGAMPPFPSRRRLTVHAIRGPNAGSELAMLQTLQSMRSVPPPVMPALLRGCTAASAVGSALAARTPAALCGGASEALPSLRLDRERVLALAEETVAVSQLNPDQAEVLRRVAEWLAPAAGTTRAPPVLLAHGVFGAGKSFMLVTILRYLSALLGAARVPVSGAGAVRVMFAAATNVAVDRVLLVPLRCHRSLRWLCCSRAHMRRGCRRRGATTLRAWAA